jgi:uncharacterized protein (DUF2164 family)
MALDPNYKDWSIEIVDSEHQTRRAELSHLEMELFPLEVEERGFSEFYDQGIKDAQAGEGSHLQGYLERGK